MLKKEHKLTPVEAIKYHDNRNVNGYLMGRNEAINLLCNFFVLTNELQFIFNKQLYR